MYPTIARRINPATIPNGRNSNARTRRILKTSEKNTASAKNPGRNKTVPATNPTPK